MSGSEKWGIALFLWAIVVRTGPHASEYLGLGLACVGFVLLTRSTKATR